MAVTQTGANGIFTRLGKLFKVARDVESHQSTISEQIEDVIDEYNSTNMKYADALFDSTENWQLSAANIYTAISILARDTIIGMVDDDTTLNQKTIKNAVEELIDQMDTSGAATATIIGTADLDDEDGTDFILTNADGSTVTFHTDPTKNFGDTSNDDGDHRWIINTKDIEGGDEVRKATQAIHIACLAAIAAGELDMTAVPATDTGTQTSFTLTQTTAGTAGNTAITLVTGVTADGETAFTGGGNDIKGNEFTATGSGDGGTVFTSGSGNGYVITSVTNGEGKLFQNLHQDSIKVKCIRDAQVTGTAGRETHVLIGQKRISDIRHPDWPGGNGQSSVMSVSDPSYNQQRGLGRNGLNNSDFEDFSTTDTPDKWAIVVGAAGTTIKEEGTTVHRGSKSLELVGDAGGTLMHISQSFNTSGQTTTKLYPETRYCVSFWTYRAADVAAGVLRVSVKDGDAAILDSGSAALSVTLTSDAGGAWVHHSFSFSTPLDLPDAAAFHIELTTAITNTKLVHIDGVQMFRMAHLTNTSSCHIAIIPGSTDFIVDDEVAINISEATHSFMQTYMNKFLGLEGLGLQMPYQTDGSETAADSLIA